MIVDCHTHIWRSPAQLGLLDNGDPSKAVSPRAARNAQGQCPSRHSVPAADPDHHWAESGTVDKSIVLGFKSRYLKAEVPNRYIADYVKRFPQKLIGFAGIDPTDLSAVSELQSAKADLHLQGLSVSPANQDFHPSDSRAMKVFAEAERLDMPLVVHPGSQLTDKSKMDYGRPCLWDEIARTFPRLKIILAQMGRPWVEETLFLLGKHDNIFADVSGLLSRSWPTYNALVMAHQYQVMDKLLFGSDFPYNNAADCIESLYSVNRMTLGTNLPVVPREALRGIVERDTLSLLGLH